VPHTILPDALKAEMPLRLPAGFAATYSWSEDRSTLLAFIRDTTARPEGARSTTEAGDYTYADSTLVLDRDIVIDTWEVECVQPGAIELHLYRREGDELVRVGQSERVQMTRPGLNRFTLPAPIAAKKGDILGFYIPGETTHIAADSGGRMLFVEGSVAEARTPLSRWQTEAKRTYLRAFNAAEAAREKPAPPTPAPGVLVLQNFPSTTLPFRLFDLAAKAVASQGEFQRGHSLPLPPRGRHFLLWVGHQ
jgi:hypothetical protein